MTFITEMPSELCIFYHDKYTGAAYLVSGRAIAQLGFDSMYVQEPKYRTNSPYKY